jgi:hypothetical protein
VAGRAGHQGLAAHSGHELCPRGLRLPRCGEVCEFADLVHLHPGRFAAEFASSLPQSPQQLCAGAAGDDRGGEVVGEDRFPLPFERDAAEPCDQWFPAGSLQACESQAGFRFGGTVKRMPPTAISQVYCTKEAMGCYSGWLVGCPSVCSVAWSSACWYSSSHSEFC